MPLTGEYRSRFRNPYVVVHRGDLYRKLLAACQASDTITLCANSSVVGYRQDGTSATVELDSGAHITGDAVIGADGIHSVIRQQMLGDGEPRNSGITVYRAIIPMTRVPDELRWNTVTWWAGPKCHFVHYPIAGGRFLNLAVSFDNGEPEPFSGVPVQSDHVRRTFAMLGDVPQRLLDLGADWKSWVLVDRDPVADWTDGRVVLLGDAAHPMLHYAAQGACQALEDAVLLGELMDCAATEFALRFEKYNAQRRERTARIQLVARESIRLWHPIGADAVARNRMLAAMSATELHDHVAWMHGVRDFGEAQSEAQSGAQGATRNGVSA
jgi:3-hydroxybenzoate 6-monooxygenase